jgi:hypothetical protein
LEYNLVGTFRLDDIDQVLENMDKEEFTSFIDLSSEEMEAFLPRSAVETRVGFIN